MSSSVHTATTIFQAILVAFGALSVRSTPADRASAEDFQPIREADMPEGFPDYTPVGEIEVKQYPAYRKAYASGGGEFWTLFRHIQRNRVKMTAPVEMDYGDPADPRPEKRAMSFLYERLDQGTTGREGKVEVYDAPPTTVISIGCRGRLTPSAIAEARQKLVQYLAEDHSEYVAAGPLRVMGYNSPFVPNDRNFFEVQIPVKPVANE